MRVLLDTHIFLWAVTGSTRLKAPARRLIEAADEVYVSAVSIWEIAIKSRLGKVQAEPTKLVDVVHASGFRELPVTSTHAAGVARLPRHHGDPFDHLLLAQALAEPLKLLTADKVIAQYSELVMLV